MLGRLCCGLQRWPAPVAAGPPDWCAALPARLRRHSTTTAMHHPPHIRPPGCSWIALIEKNLPFEIKQVRQLLMLRCAASAWHGSGMHSSSRNRLCR